MNTTTTTTYESGTIGKTLLTRCGLDKAELPVLCDGIDLTAPRTPALFGDDGTSAASMRADSARSAIRSSLRAWRLANAAAKPAAQAKVTAAIRAAL
jgi:hypothetical protein